MVIFANKKHRLDTMERIHTIEYDTGKSGHLSFRKERYILIFQSDMIDDFISHRFYSVNFVCTLLSLKTWIHEYYIIVEYNTQLVTVREEIFVFCLQKDYFKNTINKNFLLLILSALLCYPKISKKNILFNIGRG